MRITYPLSVAIAALLCAPLYAADPAPLEAALEKGPDVLATGANATGEQDLNENSGPKHVGVKITLNNGRSLEGLFIGQDAIDRLARQEDASLTER